MQLACQRKILRSLWWAPSTPTGACQLVCQDDPSLTWGTLRLVQELVSLPVGGGPPWGDPSTLTVVLHFHSNPPHLSGLGTGRKSCIFARLPGWVCSCPGVLLFFSTLTAASTSALVGESSSPATGGMISSAI